jgi:hypothetical protein
MNAKNKDLPANPLQFKSHLGQDIVLSGMTKHESAALAILQTLLTWENTALSNDQDQQTRLINLAYNLAESFCQYQPAENQ